MSTARRVDQKDVLRCCSGLRGQAAVAVAITACLLANAASAQQSLTSFQRQQREQERARAMATELLSDVLDIQLRQLEENQLTKLPIYAEIKSMRGNLGQLVEERMQEVVALLVQAERATGDEREKNWQDARAKIRSVVVTLMAERQKLYKRMRLARLAAQLRQLIDAESKVLQATRGLPETSPQIRERTILAALEDQRDVAAIHFQFVEVLSDVATWDGTIGAGAAKGLRLLKTLQIDRELQRADQSLATGQSAEAEKAEQAALRGWQALLEVIEQTQGLDGADRDAVARLIASLIQQQEKVRDQTRQAKPDDLQRTEQLAQQQHEIHRQLGELSGVVRQFANTEALAEQAQAASFTAEAKLFEGATTDAVQQQGQVIGSLAEMEKRLQQASGAMAEKTAEELAQQVNRLAQLDQTLDQVRAKQSEVLQQAKDNARAAKSVEDQVTQQLQQANQAADFGAAIETRLADAQEDVARAQTSLANPAPQLATDRVDAAQEASQAIDQVAAEVKQQLADVRREQLAVQLGEIARAAEALERAAAAERDVAQMAHAAGEQLGLTAEQGAKLNQEQARVGEVVRSIARGVANTAPQAAEQLRGADAGLNAVKDQLDQATKQPGEPGKPAALQAAQAARQVAERLESAARELRQKSNLDAATLAKLAEEQLRPVTATRQEVEQALGEIEPQQATAARIAALERALATTRSAQIEQLRAGGKEDAARAERLADQLDEALRTQQAAEDAVRDLMHGRTNSPLRSAALEERVGELARELATEADAAVSPDLRTAADAAAEAAKEMLVGNPLTATAARQKTREALQRARQTAGKIAGEAAQRAATEPDREAQQRVSAFAREAGTQAQVEAPEAAQTLSSAAEQSQTAEQALAASQPPVATAAQKEATAALEASAKQLRSALELAQQQQREHAEALGERASKLADQAVPVDAGAAVALKQAATAARASATEPQKMPAAEEEQRADAVVRRGLERATASLAAREQELQRDKDIAEALAQLTKDQQDARDTLAEQAAKLAELASKKDPASEERSARAEPTTPEQVDAARKLADAADRFAEAQRATGEGAAEISGQQQVVNQPIREGLETASELGQLMPPTMPTSEEVAADDSSERMADPAAESSASSETSQTSELGTDFVPRSPDETARRIAGREAIEEAAKMLAQQQPTAAEPLDGDLSKQTQAQAAQNSQQPEESQPMSSQQSQAAKKGEGAVASAKAGKNDELDTTMMEQSETSKSRDSRAGSENEPSQVNERAFQDDPWFARLPPSLQKAIQARSRRNPPRGYEERLKRYFESVDQ